MLTRTEIDKIITEVQTGATEGFAAMPPGPARENASLIIVGLALLGNFLGDISDIAVTARIKRGAPAHE